MPRPSNKKSLLILLFILFFQVQSFSQDGPRIGLVLSGGGAKGLAPDVIGSGGGTINSLPSSTPYWAKLPRKRPMGFSESCSSHRVSDQTVATCRRV